MNISFKIYFSYCLLFLLIGLSSVRAQESTSSLSFEDGLFPELVVSARAMAMGNAFISKVDDESSPFYNPAGLGTFRKWSLSLSNVYAETNKAMAQTMTEGDGDATWAEKVNDSFDIDGLRKLHLDNPGNVSHSRIAFAPNFTTRFFSAGYFYSRRSRGYLGTESTSQFEFADRRDHGPYAAVNLSLFGGVIKVGATGFYLLRKVKEGTVDKDTEVVIGPEQRKNGRMFLGTIGGKITLPVYALPTFSATIHNAGNQDFTQMSDSQYAPQRIKQNVVLGFSLTPQIGNTTRIHLEGNFRDAGNRYDNLETSDRLSGGIEFDFFRTVFFRGGYIGGHGAGGLGVRIRNFRLELSSYAVDVDTRDFEDRTDRRFAFTISGGI